MKTCTWSCILILLMTTACKDGSGKEDKPSPAKTTGQTLITEANKDTTSNPQTKPAPNDRPDTLYHIFGTEPFWSMVIAKPLSTYSSADGDTLFLELKEIRQAQARPDGYVQVFEFEDHQSLVLRQLNNCSCSDGMSDREHPLQATLILKEKVLEGCGRTPSHTY